MSESQALARQEATPQTGFGAMLQQAPQPQGLTPTVVPLDRETLTFYGNMILAAGLVPEEKGVSAEMSKFRVMAKTIAGTSYGFDPVLAQQCFDVVKNRMVPNAHGMEILFRDSGEYDTRIEELTDDVCRVIVLQRDGGEWDASRNQYVGGEWKVIGKVEFTFEMAKAARLHEKNPTWNAFRQDMLYSKVMKRVVKRYNPTCLRPRILLGNNFAKQQQPQLEAPAAPVPQQIQEAAQVSTIDHTVQAREVQTAEVGQTYQDQPYTGGASAPSLFQDDDDDGVEAEVIDVTASVSQDSGSEESGSALEELRGHAQELLMSRFDGPESVDAFLNGRDINRMYLPPLRALVAELEAMPNA